METDNGSSDVDIEDVSFEESENYVQRRRQKEILDAAKDALETRSAAREELARGEIDTQTCREVLRISVENLIAEVEHMVQRVGENHLWSQKQLGDPITISPPDRLVGFIQDDTVDPIGGVDIDPKTVTTIYGLEGYRNAPAVFTATWSVNADTRHHGPQEKTFTGHSQMPIAVSETAISEIRGFLNRSGLGIDARLNDYTGDSGPGL